MTMIKCVDVDNLSPDEFDMLIYKHIAHAIPLILTQEHPESDTKTVIWVDSWIDTNPDKSDIEAKEQNFKTSVLPYLVIAADDNERKKDNIKARLDSVRIPQNSTFLGDLKDYFERNLNRPKGKDKPILHEYITFLKYATGRL